MKKILVICIGNSCRSQIAHGYLASLVPAGTEIYSAGISPDGLNPRAVATMLEDGIDIAHHSSNAISEYDGIDFDYVITLCDSVQEKCANFFPNAKRLHQHFPDPWNARGTEEEIERVFRSVRNQLKTYSNEFVINYL
jgi:arsenate reductase (thioredoxin)